MTTSFADSIRDLQVEPGKVALVWLGQASYLLKTPAGLIVMIDPYLSDWAEQQWGMKRVIPAPLQAEDLTPDLLLVSHWHEDHFDVPAVKIWAKATQGSYIAAPTTCTSRSIAWGWPADHAIELAEGSQWQLGDLQVTATYARHDTPTAPSPDAIGFILQIGDLRIWNVADSEYDAHLRELGATRSDVAILPINGVGGNMNAHEAALLAWQTQPRTAIPMHYNMWSPADFGPGATLDPALFIDTLDKLGGGPKVLVLQVGEVVTLTSYQPSDDS